MSQDRQHPAGRPHDGEPHDGIWPGEAEWLRWEPPFEPSADFSDRVLGAMGSDRSTPSDGEAKDDIPQDDITLPRHILDAFEVPEPSPDFVERTFAAVWSDVGGSDHTVDDAAVGPPDEEAWEDRLDAYGVPAPSASFVTRTLAAIQAERGGGERDVQPPRPVRMHVVKSGARSGWAAAAAAAVLVGLGLFWWMSNRNGASDGPNDADLVVQAFVPPAADHSPTLTAIAMARVLDPSEQIAAAPDPLLLLAAGELGR